jgi:hypothetical protein
MTQAAGPETQPKKSKASKARRAWGYYRWFDRIKGWHDWANWIGSFFQTKAGLAVALGSTAALTTAAVVGHNMVDDPYDDLFTPTEIAAPASPDGVRQTKSTRIFAIEGHDKAGRRATFDVVVANKDFLWVRGSSEELEKAGVVMSGEALAKEVLDADVRGSLMTSTEIIAVGTASQEGDAREETQRAKRRAERTAELIKGAVEDGITISTLNLGQFRGRETGGTNWQRPFMIIAVKEVEPGANISEALRDALTGKEKLPSPASYSAFDLARAR